MTLKTPPALLALGLAAVAPWAAALPAQVPLQDQGLQNQRSRVPHSTESAVDCALADLDGSGRLDMIRATNSNVLIGRQDRGGRFLPSGLATVPLPRNASGIHRVAVGQLTADKALDVLVAYRNGECAVLENNGWGAVSRIRKLPPLVGVFRPTLVQVLIGDLDGRNGDDVVVILNQALPQVYLSNGLNGFGTPQALKGPTWSYPVAALVDVDRDKDLDIVFMTGNRTNPATPITFINSRGALAFGGAFFGNTRVAARHLLVADVTGNGQLDIVVVPASATAAAPVVFAHNGKVYQAKVASQKLRWTNPWAVVAVDVNGDRFPDLVGLQADGSLVLGMNGGRQSAGVFAAGKTLVDAMGRRCLVGGDLEPDQDIDLFLGGWGSEDIVLLGDGKGGFLNTEDRGMPIGKHGWCAGALVDTTGEGDPDIVLYDGNGRPTLLANQLGQARFKVVASNALPLSLPVLPAGRYFDMDGASVATTGAHDVLVLGAVTSQGGIRVLVRRKSGSRYYHRDETSSRFGKQGGYVAMAVADMVGSAKGSAGTPGYSDIVVLDTAGQLQLVINRKGTYAIGGTRIDSNVEAGSRVLVGHVNPLQDNLRDIVLLQPTQGIKVYLGQSTPADTYKLVSTFKATPVIPAAPGGPAILADLTGDLAPDLVFATAAMKGQLQLLQGNGLGSFKDATTTFLPATGPSSAAKVSSLRVLRSKFAANPALLIGMSDSPDLVMRRTTAAYSAPRQLAYRGSRVTLGHLVGDLDLDGDEDVVVLRTSLPGLVLGHDIQLTQNSITQAGRDARFVAGLPSATAVGLVAIAFVPTRVPIPGLGVLRLPSSLVQVPQLTFNAKVRSVAVPIPASMGAMSVPLQLFVIDRGRLYFGNLDMLELTRH